MTAVTTPGPIDVRTERFADFMADYPFASEVERLEELPVQRFTGDDTGEVFEARVLGFGSSYRTSHRNHAPGTKPGKGVRCSGCRWTDTAILWARPLESVSTEHGYAPTGDWQYVFVSIGKSAIEGEWQRDTVIWTDAPIDVLRKLFVPTKPGFKRDTGDMAIPPHNAEAFREAARIDERLAELLAQYEEAFPPERLGTGADPLAGL